MTGPSTRFDPDEVMHVSGRHKSDAARIESSVDGINNDVKSLLAGNPSAMTRALNDGNDAWTKKIRDVVNDLRQEASMMDQAVNEQSEQDARNANNIQQGH